MGGLAGELLEFARAQVFFAELDIVDAGPPGLGDLGEQGAAPGAFVAAKLASVGDVVEQAAVRHPLSAYYGRLLCGPNTLIPANGSTRQTQRRRTGVSPPHQGQLSIKHPQAPH